MIERPWRLETVHANFVGYPNGKAVYQGVVFDTVEECKDHIRAEVGLKPGRTLILHRHPAQGNCLFCERELADEVDWILYTIERDRKHLHKLVDKAMNYYGDMLYEHAEVHHADEGGGIGMAEGRFELEDHHIHSSMFEAMYAAWGGAYIDDHEAAVEYWKTRYMGGMYRNG